MRRFIRVGAALASLVVTSTLSLGVAAAPAQAAETCARFGRYYTIHHASKGGEAKAVECLLKNAGFHAHENGYISWYDVARIKEFQRSRHLPVTGVVDSRTWAALRAVNTTSRATTKGAIALAFAKQHIGDRYVFAGTGPHQWDCSGLTQAAWRAAGVYLPHSSQLQYYHGTHISKSQLRPGDLVFFYSGRSHVALYAGNGLVLHASRPGEPVGYLPMKYMPYNGAVRPG